MNSVSNIPVSVEQINLKGRVKSGNSAEAMPQDFISAIISNMQNNSENSQNQAVAEVISKNNSEDEKEKQINPEAMLMFGDMFICPDFLTQELSSDKDNINIENVSDIQNIPENKKMDMTNVVAENEQTILENLPVAENVSVAENEQAVVENVPVAENKQMSVENFSVNENKPSALKLADTEIFGMEGVLNEHFKNSSEKNIAVSKHSVNNIRNAQSAKQPKQIKQNIDNVNTVAERFDNAGAIAIPEHNFIDNNNVVVQSASNMTNVHANVSIALQNNSENIAQVSGESYSHTLNSNLPSSDINSDAVADLSEVKVITKVDENNNMGNQNTGKENNNHTYKNNDNPIIQQHKIQSEFYKGVNEVRKFMAEKEETSSEKTETSTIEQEAVEINVSDLQMAFNNNIRNIQPKNNDSVQDIYNPSEIMKQTTEGIVQKLPTGEEKFVITLNPEGLGEITVTILKNDTSGILTLSSTDEKTAEILNSNISSLQESLKNLSIDISDVRVENPQETLQYDGYEEQYEEHNGRHKNQKEDNSVFYEELDEEDETEE